MKFLTNIMTALFVSSLVSINLGAATPAAFRRPGADPEPYVYATYLGGTGEDHLRDVAVDLEGYIVLAGSTYSEDVPTLNAYQNVYEGGVLNDIHVVVGALGAIWYLYGKRG
ncbi:MAG: hypothetical protein NWE89_02800 [Candidatus Bathyarchaeota archaeon]|nr:hypothetical protein [Candidatus Bathyarchaeota archaeon]